MSIIICPECKTKVDASNETCPNCGYPLKAQSISNVAPQQPKVINKKAIYQKYRKRKFTTVWAMVIFALICGLISLFLGVIAFNGLGKENERVLKILFALFLAIFIAFLLGGLLGLRSFKIITKEYKGHYILFYSGMTKVLVYDGDIIATAIINGIAKATLKSGLRIEGVVEWNGNTYIRIIDPNDKKSSSILK